MSGEEFHAEKQINGSQSKLSQSKLLYMTQKMETEWDIDWVFEFQLLKF